MMKQKIRRSGLKIMSSLIVLLGSLSYIMILAVINGSLGFICAMGVTVVGAIGVAKILGETICLSYTLIIILLVLFGVLRGILRYFEQYSNHYIAFKLLSVLRDKIFAKLRKLAPQELDNDKKGSIIALITSDIETLEVFYAHTISPICIACIVSLLSMLFVGLISSWYLVIIQFISYIVIGIIVPIISSKKLKSSGVIYRNEFSSFNAYFLDSIKGIKDIVLNNNASLRNMEVNRRSDKLLTETKKMKNDITKSSSIVEMLVSICIFLSLLLGIFLVKKEIVSFGRMLIAIVTIFSSFGPVIAISSLPGNLTQTLASGNRVLDLLAKEPQVKEIKSKNDIEYHNLDVKNLSFSYNNQIEVLKDISLKAKKGEIIGIVGDSGSGKSTLLKLLLRFWQKSGGNIEYNGIDIENINTNSLLENVTMVSQSTYLFDETIEDNIRLASLDAKPEDIYNACKMVSIHDFIMGLPLGYKTPVGMLGDNLSAGEKQRIGLARAFLRGSQLILLDEPTSNVDSINEGIILKSLKEQKSKKSIILVSHRESTMAIADRVYRIEKGIIYEYK